MQHPKEDPNITEAAARLDYALDQLCTLFAWVNPKASTIIAEQASEEDIDTSGMSKSAATMYEAAGTLELLMLRLIRCKKLKPLLD